ncbi:uncharacterized protein LOC124540658 [Vanessa cardui]|uniref:uncharacterized protein LOC124540658 n=1 Tax=Vanessa cardui TaxID=171605 RepID=UPI001F12C8EA|nr:uncharacterized protein LOC124540658 [Vanessa cardui]
MLFIIFILFAFNLHSYTKAAETPKYDTMVVQPLTSTTPGSSTTKNDVTLKSTTLLDLKTTQSTTEDSIPKYKERTRASEYDYNKPEQPYQESVRDQINYNYLTDREVLDIIYELILKNKNLNDDPVPSHCPYRTKNHKNNNNKQKNNDYMPKENIFLNDYDANLQFDHQYQGFNEDPNQIKVPLETLESPENGVLGRLYFRFDPTYNKKRRHGRN